MKKILFLASLPVMMLMMALTSCSTGENEEDNTLRIISSKDVVINSKGTSQIICSDPNATYTSEDEYIATVSYDGVISAQRIGETYILVNGKREVKVTVTPLYTSFTEPKFLFGATKSEVYSKVGNNYYSSSESSIIYTPTSGRVDYYFYMMKDGKVYGIAMVLSTLYYESLTDFFLERYRAIDFDDENYMITFINALSLEKATRFIGEQLYSASMIIVLYIPYSHESTKSIVADKKQDYFDQAREILDNLGRQ